MAVVVLSCQASQMSRSRRHKGSSSSHDALVDRLPSSSELSRRLTRRRRERQWRRHVDAADTRDAGRDAEFPLAAVTAAGAAGGHWSDREKERSSDRGYFVTATGGADEYSLADTSELIEDFVDENEQLAARVQSARARFTVRSGLSDAKEEIMLQAPHQAHMAARHVRSNDSDTEGDVQPTWRDEVWDWRQVDASKPASDFRCAGCAARFQCNQSSLPGFLPVSMFEDLSRVRAANTLCRRCYLLKEHDFLLNVTVSPVDYKAAMAPLKHNDELLLVLIVDMLDMENSIYTELADVVGGHMRKPMIVVGNKVDLLPTCPNPDYLKHYETVLKQVVERSGFADRFNILDYVLCSARVGFGVERLISRIHTQWGVRGDVCLLGCTNVGKSSLFNALLQSDLCKIRAVDLVQRATATVWPGTTLHLLKFPVMNMHPVRLVARRVRLRENSEMGGDVEQHAHAVVAALTSKNVSPQDTLQGFVGRTFRREPELKGTQSARATEAMRHAAGVGFAPQQMGLRPVQARTLQTPRRRRRAALWDPDNVEFKYGKWCYDSPGIVSAEQVINELTLEELLLVVPRRPLQPRTVRLRPKHSILLGGLARLNYLYGDHPIFCTIFASSLLPVHVMSERSVRAFYAKYGHTPVLAVPAATPRRRAQMSEGMSHIPTFLPKINPTQLDFVDTHVTGAGERLACGDVTLSSAGWVAVTAPDNAELTLRAYTPSGRGVHWRAPALLPDAVAWRGRRVPGTDFYAVRPMRMPDMRRKVIPEVTFPVHDFQFLRSHGEFE